MRSKNLYQRALPALALSLLLPAAALQAVAEEKTQATVTIIDHLQADSIITVEMPEGLEERLVRQGSATESAASTSETKVGNTPTRAAGYRVQVYSDGNSRTAKAEASARARNISARLPQYRTYVVYTSPYWRLKVGDFRTQADAQAAADEIRRAFPAYSKEVRVVRDRISTTK